MVIFLVELPTLTCEACGHTWNPRTSEPQKCPKCGYPVPKLVRVDGIGLIEAPTRGESKIPIGEVNLYLRHFNSLKKFAKQLKREDDQILDAMLDVSLKYPDEIRASFPPPVIDLKTQQLEYRKALEIIFWRGETRRIKKAMINDDDHLYQVAQVLQELFTPAIAYTPSKPSTPPSPQKFRGEYAVLRDDFVIKKLVITSDLLESGPVSKVEESNLENAEKYGLSPKEVAEIIDKTIEEAQR